MAKREIDHPDDLDPNPARRIVLDYYEDLMENEQVERRTEIFSVRITAENKAKLDLLARELQRSRMSLANEFLEAMIEDGFDALIVKFDEEKQLALAEEVHRAKHPEMYSDNRKVRAAS